MACDLVGASNFLFGLDVVVPTVVSAYFLDFCSILRGSHGDSSSLCGLFVHIAYIVLYVVVLLKVEEKGRHAVLVFLRC